MQANLSEFSKNPEHVLVYADTREDPSIIEELERRGCRVKVLMLDIGDYIVSDRTAVERKTREDFENSIMDGRLFDQMARLKDTYEKVVCIIEGQHFVERISRKALLAAVSSLMLDFGVSVFFTKNSEGTAELICALATREQVESERKILIKRPAKNDDINKSILYTVASIPSVGEKTAEKLLRHFGNLQKLFNATEQEIMEVEGIGKKRAREISRFLRTRFEPSS
ncbi:MAG: ERCC4 domain-containing protein [Candidatus Micrarchaeia archaeon]